MNEEKNRNFMFQILAGICSLVIIIVIVLIIKAPIIANRSYPLVRYEGRVVDSKTGKAIAGIKVQGRYYINDGWQLHVDGFYSKKEENVYCVSDSNGTFKLEMPGFMKKIFIKDESYKNWSIYTDDILDSKNIKIELEYY